MKIIELLNKIANGEEIKKIKYQNHIYEYYDGDFREDIDVAYVGNWLFASEIIDLSNLNDEIEIIEDTFKEDKKIEHINKTYDLTDFMKDYPEVANLVRALGDKQYEIIEYLNERGKQC